MGVLGRYVCVRYALHASIVLLVLSALTLTFDLMETADNILNQSDGNAAAVMRYAGLRLPEIVARMLPFAAMLGALSVVGMMMRYGELVAMWSAGISPAGVLRRFLPTLIGLAAVQFVLSDRVVPAVTTELYAWGVGDFRRETTSGADMDAVWLMSGRDVIRLQTQAARIGRIENVAIFQRDATGVVYGALEARSAEPTDGGWRLRDVTEYRTDPVSTAKRPEMMWSGAIDLHALGLLSGGLRDLTLREMDEIIRNQAFGQRPVYLAETWFSYRIAASLTPALLLAFAVACAQSFRRSGGFAWLLVVCLASGFAYLVIDNVSLALGETGFLPPWFAGAAPKLAFASLIGFLLVRREA